MNKLGLGFLRLPMTGEEGAKVIDMAAAQAIVDRYIEKGGKYFDTAYTYLDGTSEPALREVLVKRYPRESFMLADKIPSWKPTSYEDAWKYVDEMLERCGVEYFDVLMLHWLNAAHYDIVEKYDGFRVLREAKEKGIAREIGFSFHDSAEVLERILSAHPEVDYVLMQINYLDWNNAGVQSRLCYETAMRHGKKIIVMEPVKGGTLASVPEEAMELFEKAAPGRTPAEWAVKFVKGLPGVTIMLSGMGAPEQVDQNIAPMEPMTEEELEVIDRVRTIILGKTAIPCTGCRYCVDHTPSCPMNINIPEYFKLYNAIKRYPGDGWKIKPAFNDMTTRYGAPSQCIKCRMCERNCPQQLHITDLLQQVAEEFK